MRRFSFQFFIVAFTMKSHFLFFLIYVTRTFSTRNSAIPFAIHEIIRDFYVNQSESFDFIVYGRKSENLLQLVNDVMKVKSDYVFSCEMLQVTEGNGTIRIVRSAILLFDTLHSYHEFHARAALENDFPKSFNFLVFIEDFDEKTLENFPFPNSFNIFRSSTFLSRNFASKSLKLTTFIAFQQPICRTFVVVHINWFSKKWKTRNFFIEKFKNFNQCWIFVEIDFQNIPYAEVLFDRNLKVTDVRGPMIDIHLIISKIMNFYVFYNFRDMENKKLVDPNIIADHRLSIEPVRKPMSNATALIQPIIAMDYFIIASRSQLYSAFEKVFLPFEHEVWVWLAVTLGIGTATILLLKGTNKHVQKFVFGLKVKTPMLNFMLVVKIVGV